MLRSSPSPVESAPARLERRVFDVRQDVLGAPVSDRPPEVAPVRLRPARQTIVTEAIDRAALEAVTAADG